MSRENAEIVEESIQCFSSGDHDRLAELYHEDAIVVAPEGWPEAGPFVGIEAVMRNYAQIQEDWDSHELTVASMAVQGDFVVAKLVWRVRGRGSGAPARLDVTGVHWLRDGKIAEARFYRDHQKALEAVGLRE